MSGLSFKGGISHNADIVTQNPFDVLCSVENGGSDGGLPQSYTDHDPDIDHEWTKIINSRKRQRVNTDNTQKPDIDFEKLSADDKLSVMFAEMSNIGRKVDQCLSLHHKVHSLETQMSEHNFRLSLLEYKSLDLEARSRRNNLIFGGIPEGKNEDCHNKIADFLKVHLGIEESLPMPRVHRLGRYRRDSTRPIIVNFLDSRDTEYVISKANNLKGTAYNINRDFPKEIVAARKMLWPHYKQLRSDYPDSKVNIVYPAKLIQDGRTVADVFPHWNTIMQGDRVVSNKVVFTNVRPPQTESRISRENDAPIIKTNSQTPIQASLEQSKQVRSQDASSDHTGNTHPHRSRRQSNSPRPSRAHAPSRERAASARYPARSSQSTTSSFRRPWTQVDDYRQPGIQHNPPDSAAH
jgi:hypothetical protein